MHNCALHSYCSVCICYFINFRSHLFFSLFSVHNQWTQFSSPHLLFPQMHTNKHTHTHTHTQTNPHWQSSRETDRSSWVLIGAWSEHVGLDRWLIEARGSWSMLDRSLWVLIGAWLELVGPDRCLTGAHGSWSVLDWGLIVAWLELVLIGACGTIGARGSFAWTELDREGSCLIGTREIWPRGRVGLCWSELGSLTEKGLAWGRVDRR